MDLRTAIKNAKTTIQNFADTTKIPYYRMALILYGQDALSVAEVEKIETAYGAQIFLPTD